LTWQRPSCLEGPGRARAGYQGANVPVEGKQCPNRCPFSLCSQLQLENGVSPLSLESSEVLGDL